MLPFSAVVGQDEAKLALVLTACDRRVGGVLLRGEKGSAKSTLARGLAALLPGEALFVELPVGATEDRVVGTLDLAAALTGGEMRFDPGLLAAADGGVLYVDEINLLPDHLVDILLDVAASGVNRVEREGLSHSHPSRFLLVGSMNPEEGDLRPQLLDRFGLAVDMHGTSDPKVRAAAVRRRLEFDADPEAVLAAYAPEDAAVAKRLEQSVPASVPDRVVDAVAAICAQVGAEGLRADLTICRAAGALAGWEGRSEADSGDVRRIAHLALAHRARRDPLDPPGLDRRRLGEAMNRHLGGSEGPDAVTPNSGDRDGAGDFPATSEGSAEPRGDDPQRPGDREGPGSGRDRGAPSQSGDSGVPGATSAIPARLPGGQDLAAPAGGRRIDTPSARGRIVGDRPPAGAITSVAVTATVRHAAARKPRPAGDGDALSGAAGALVRPEDLREAVRHERTASLVVLTVDASGSMGARYRMDTARSAVLGMLRDAYQRRDLVSVVAFRGTGAEVLLKPTASVEVARARLAEIATGGQTPLAAGLRSALGVALTPSRAASHSPLIVLVTDGRATGSPGDGDPFRAALSAAGEVARAGVPSVVIDVEGSGAGPGRTQLGLARNLAAAMGGRYVRATDLTADVIQRAAGQAPAGQPAQAVSAAAASSHEAGAPSADTRPDSTTTSQGAPGTS
jgi:magnesium chelatase subunit D